jgi:O-antigen ligase
MTAIAAVRLAGGATLAWHVAGALAGPAMPARVAAAALVVAALTAWRPAAGLAAVVVLAPAGLLLAEPPAAAAELLAWTFLAAWLLPVRRPLAAAPLPRAVAVPALVYFACVFGSWLAQALPGATGVDPLALPLFFLRLPAEYLANPAQEPYTWRFLQTAAGLSVLVAAASVAAPDPRRRRAVAYAAALGAAVLALLTAADVLRQWADQGYGARYLLRYVQGERFSLHLADLNAAGSHFVLGGLVAAAFAALERRRRALWIAAAAAIVPAIWLTGSRSAAIGGALVGLVLVPLARGRAAAGPAARRAGIAAAPVIAVAAAVALVAVARQPETEGSASRSLRIRAEFLQTSARMLASAPLLGVGIGRYHERSAEFMPPALRAIYPRENAHNYFAQQFAELGVVGGAAFVWLAIALLRQAWRGVRAHAGDAAAAGLLAGCAGYLVTCLTGHPLLVPEAALPFWIAAGAAAAAPGPARVSTIRAASAAALAVIAAGAAAGALGYTRPARRPPDRALLAAEPAADGRRVRRAEGHAVTYVQRFRGVLILPVFSKTPAVVDVDVAGWNAGRWDVPAGRWVEIEVPLKRRGLVRFRRVDLRVREGPGVLLAAHRWRPLP